MSAENSNLNANGFTYDLVTSMTQNSLNAGMKDVLNATGENYEPIVTYYRKESNEGTGDTIEMTPDEVKTYITDNNIDIFSIPDGATDADNDILGQIYGWDIFFVGAIKAVMGTPESNPPSFMDVANAPNIITLQAGSTVDTNQTVLYNIYFKTFQVTEITIGRSSCSCSQYIQDSQDPFQFMYSVDLNIDYSTENFDALPDYMKTSVNNIIEDTSTMFSLQQLMLDLNTIKPYGTPQTIVPATSPLGPVFDAFVEQYWTPMLQNGDIVFASSASPVDYPTSNIVPTDFNFMVSPYIPSNNDNLDADTIADLATLNYLVMTNKDSMPDPLKSFTWNWVDSLNDQISGIMSVKRDVLVDNLNDLLSPLVQSLCYRVDAYSDLGNDNYLKLNTPTTTQKYTKKNSNGTYLSFSYVSEDDDHSGQLDSTQYIEGQVNVDSSVLLTGNEIKVITSVCLYTKYTNRLTEAYGWPLAQKTTTVYQLKAVGTDTDEAGLLKIDIVSNTSEDLTQTNDSYNNDHLDPSIWEEIMTGGDVNDVIDSIVDQAATLEQLMEDALSEMENIIEGSLGFVFPGAKTYFFANPKFSDQGDLTVEVAYQSVD